MIYFARWKIILVLAVCLFGLAYAAPNLVSQRTAESIPSWLPNKQVSLGLDLQGGSHLLLEVEVGAVTAERMNALVDAVRGALRDARIGYTGLGLEDGGVVFTVRDPGQAAAARAAISGLETDIRVSTDGAKVRAALTERALQERRTAALQQSIEIVRRRIDETGVREPTIQRQGDDRILVQLPGIDDPDRIKRLIGRTAKMNFRLVDLTAPAEEVRAGGRVPAGSELLPSDERGPDGRPIEFLVRKRVMVSGDTLVDAQPSFQQNQPVVSFRFDSVGARRFAAVTKENVGKPFAIVLDNKVISAPVIREAILGGSGVISGRFNVQEAQDLALLLRAGALPAPLKVLEERTVGPDLGADSIRAGAIACVLGFAFVVVAMIALYGLFGVFSVIALFINLVLIIAALSLLQATLTLPGIAGIVLTIGMAVDANVLIFERMREEERAGRTIMSAIDTGYARAFATIVDSNLTTLIAAVMLYIFGSGPVKGFAVTLSLGIVTSMFTAIMVTRLMVVIWLRRRRHAALPI